MYPNNPALNQQMAQLEQEFAQRKENLIRNFYNQTSQNTWNNQNMSSQPMSQSEAAPTQNVTWIRVNGIQGAKEHQVPANATHWLMDCTEDIFYVKSSDEFGVMKAFKGYRFMEIPQQELSGVPEPVDMSQYVSKKDFDELKELIAQLTAAQKKQPAKGNKEVVDNG